MKPAKPPSSPNKTPVFPPHLPCRLYKDGKIWLVVTDDEAPGERCVYRGRVFRAIRPIRRK